MDGDPGLGKSAVTCDLAARISTGREMPDGTPLVEPRGVVLVSCEDGAADTIVPRLIAAGADRSRIVHLPIARRKNGAEVPLVIPDDLEQVHHAIRRVEAGLVIIDPLVAHLSERTNSWNDQHVRRALTPLAAFAERERVAVGAVRHLSKAEQTKAIRAGGGSIGIIGQARFGLIVAEDPDNPAERLLAVTKCNVSAKASTLRFRMVEATGQTEDGDEWKAGRVEWLGESGANADDLVQSASPRSRRGSALHLAEEFLHEWLTDGPVASNVLTHEAERAGIAPATLNRAKDKLRVASYRREAFEKRGTSLEERGEGDRWFACLPEDTPMPRLGIRDAGPEPGKAEGS